MPALALESAGVRQRMVVAEPPLTAVAAVVPVAPVAPWKRHEEVEKNSRPAPLGVDWGVGGGGWGGG